MRPEVEGAGSKPAVLAKATKRPWAEMAGKWLSAKPALPAESTLTVDGAGREVLDEDVRLR